MVQLKQTSLCRMRRAPRTVTLLAAMVFALTAGPSAQGLNIILNFDSGQSETPSFDSDGSLLQALFQWGESHYQSIIEDSHTLTINYWYEDLDDSTLGQHSLVSQSGGRETEANIRIDTRVGTGGAERTSFFFDTTPGNHSEFDMQQILYRDYSGTVQSDWFVGSLPGLTEVGYEGAAVVGGAADGLTDVLSVVIHEIGHALGMSAANDSTVSETNDDDYDFNSSFIDGFVGGIQTANDSGEDGENIAHLESTDTLMTPFIPASTRRLPSAADIFAMSAGHSYSDIDLFRQDMWSGGSINTASNWEGNQVPDAGDHAYIRYGTGTATLNGFLNFNDLTVSDGSDVQLNGQDLTVDNDVVLERLAAHTSGDVEILIPTGSLLTTEDLRVFGGQIDLSGGSVVVSDYLELKYDTDSGNTYQGEIFGYGTVNVTNQLENDGEIRANGGTLVISAGLWDLDGDSGNGQVTATTGDIDLNGTSFQDAYDGDMTIGVNHFVDIQANWTLGSGGVIDMNGGATLADAAELRGGQVTVDGDVQADGFASFTGPMVINGTADFSNNDVDTELRLGNSIADTLTFNGGDFTGPGTLRFEGDSTINGTVNVSVDTFDIDGASLSDMTINAAGTLNVTSDQLSDSLSGNLIVAGGNLNMNLAVATQWTADSGSSIVINSGGAISGVKLNVFGALTTAAGGNGDINSDVDIESTATLEITAANDRLDLNGQTNWNGPASVTGFGEIFQNSNATFTADTTFNIGHYNMDGGGLNNTITVNNGVTVTLNVGQIDDAPATDGFDGTLNVGDNATIAVNTTTGWRLDNDLNMTDGALTGAPTLNGSQVRLETFTSSINASGTLASNNRAIVNADLYMSDGDLIAGNNTYLELRGSNTLAGGNFSTTATASQIELDGPTSYEGDVTLASTVSQNGTATVNAPSTITGNGTWNMDGPANTTWNIFDDLTVDVDAIDIGNNIFNGTFNFNSSADQLTIIVPTNWTMAGTFNVNSGTTLTFPSLAGSPVIFSGTGNIDGGTRFDAQTTVTGTITTVDADSTFTFGGDVSGIPALNHRIQGGTIDGPGNARSYANNQLSGYGTIAAAVKFEGSSILLADDGTLTITGAITSIGSQIGTADSDGTLNVTTNWAAAAGDTVILNGGVVTGAAITNDGAIRGHGKITAAQVNNNTTIAADGGELILDFASNPNLDGAGAGVLEAVLGDLIVVDTVTDAHNGTATVGPGRTMTFQNGWTLGGGGTLNVSGTTVANRAVVAGTTQTLANGSTTHIDRETAFEIQTTFAGTTSLPDTNDVLRLFDDSVVNASATFNGTGTIAVTSSTRLTLSNGAAVGVNVSNAGTLAIGASPGVAKVSAYSMTALGKMEMEIGGTSPGVGGHDQLIVSNNAALTGTLSLSTIGAYVPSLGDLVTLIDAAGVNGMFNTISGIPLGVVDGFDAGLAVLYQPAAVLSRVSIFGDTDLNDTVDIADLQSLAGNFGSDGSWISGDFDGDGAVTVADLQWLAGNFGAAASSPATPVHASLQAVVDIPEPASLALIGIGALMLARRRR